MRNMTDNSSFQSLNSWFYKRTSESFVSQKALCPLLRKKARKKRLFPPYNLIVKVKMFLNDSHRTRRLNGPLDATATTSADSEEGSDEIKSMALPLDMSIVVRLCCSTTVSPHLQWETMFVLPRKPRSHCQQWLSKGSHFVSLTALPFRFFFCFFQSLTACGFYKHIEIFTVTWGTYYDLQSFFDANKYRKCSKPFAFGTWVFMVFL